jgi:ketosteroid isomerase-like protein
MRQLLAVLVVVILLLPIACAPRPVDMAALRKTVDAYNNASKESMLGGSPEKLMSYYEADALEMSPNSAVIKGKDNILAYQQEMMKSGMKFNAVEFQTLELTADGKSAYEIGSYDMTITIPPMGEMKDKGKYIALWRQQADGSWKVHAETWNTDMPAPQPPAAKEEKGKKK